MTIEEPHWSYSQYDEYMLCGHRYKLRRIDAVPSKPSMAAVGGHAFHRWTENYDLQKWQYRDDHSWMTLWDEVLTNAVDAEEDKTGVPLAEWRTSGKISKATPHKEDLDWWVFNGYEMCKRYVEWRDGVKTHIALDLPPDEDGNTTGIEYKLNVQLVGQPFVGALDRIEYDEHGNLGVRDLKTGRIWKTVQPGFYAGAARLMGIKLHWWDRYDARKGVTVPDPPGQLENWTATRVATLLAQAEDQRSRHIYPVRIGEHCSYCPVWQHCEYKL